MSNYDISGRGTNDDGSEKEGLDARIRRIIREYLQDPLAFPEEYKGWLPEWITQAGIDVPISQIVGFGGFTFQPAPTILTAEATASTSYTDLATAGPTLTGLPDGAYAVFFGCQMVPAGTADAAIASVSVNGASASDDDFVVAHSDAENVSVARLLLKDLSAGGNNTLTVKYRSSGGTSHSFARRWMIVVKYANA